MPRILLYACLFCLMSRMAPCQVDTLRLVKTAGFQTPQPIFGYYLEDITGDSLLDFITYSEDHIHVTNGADYSLFWSSPAISAPEKLTFVDIDFDGQKEIFSRCGLSIEIFDPPNPGRYWTSPMIDYTFCGYAVGDRNNDSFPDLIVVRKEPFYRTGIPGNNDTVWVEAYDGPTYALAISRIHMVPNYNYFRQQFPPPYPPINMIHYETPTGVIVDNFTRGGADTDIFLFTSYDRSEIFEQILQEWEIGGNARVFRGSNLTQRNVWPQGADYHVRPLTIGDSTYVLALNAFSWGAFTRESFDRRDVACFYFGGSRVRLDTLYFFSGLATQWDFAGLTIGDINRSAQGREICFGGRIGFNGDRGLIQRGIESNQTIWQRFGMTNLDTILFAYNGPPFSRPQIVTQGGNYGQYRFYDGQTGNLSAIYNPDYYFLSRTADLDNNGIDEIICLANDSICVFSMQRTSVEDEPPTPSNHLLVSGYPNPFNSSVMIEYSISQPANVSVDIYDILGKKAANLAEKIQTPGHYRLGWDASFHSSGLYFCRVSAGNKSEVIKLVLAR